MRLDAHQHFWKYDAQRDAWITAEMAVLRRNFLPADLQPELAASAIDATIVVQADQSEAETEFLLDLAEQNKFIAGVVGWIDLRAPGVEERIEHFVARPHLVGFRHIAQAEPDDRFLVREDFLHGVSRLARHGLTYDALVYPRQLPAAIELAQKLPQQRFVLDHIAKPPIRTGEMGAWRDHIRALGECSNVFCKLSGLVTEADWKRWSKSDFRPYLDVVVEAFGTRRLMFGSDWPVCLLAGRYGQVCELIESYLGQFKPVERSGIMGENAASFYGVKTAAWTCN
jgi:L-fuconolactonase